MRNRLGYRRALCLRTMSCRGPAPGSECPTVDTPLSIGVLAAESDPQLSARARVLAERLGLPLCQPGSPQATLLLAVTASRLELRASGRGAPGPVWVDFVGGPLGYERRAGGSRLLYQAVGARAGLRVVDATAGLGEDAFLLAWKGCQVTAIERSPIVAALLEDGLRRAGGVPELREAAARVHLLVSDARAYLRSLPEVEHPDVVYLDPMFPHRRKAALVKKEMRIVRGIVGDDPDADELLEAARAAARRHVVVKRMRLAPELGSGVGRSYRGKSTRFDVYPAGT